MVSRTPTRRIPPERPDDERSIADFINGFLDLAIAASAGELDDLCGPVHHWSTPIPNEVAAAFGLPVPEPAPPPVETLCLTEQVSSVRFVDADGRAQIVTEIRP